MVDLDRGSPERNRNGLDSDCFFVNVNIALFVRFEVINVCLSEFQVAGLRVGSIVLNWMMLNGEASLHFTFVGLYNSQLTIAILIGTLLRLTSQYQLSLSQLGTVLQSPWLEEITIKPSSIT